MKRGPGRPVGSRASLAHDFAGACLALAAELTPVDDGTSWPSAKYRADPVAFSREVLGVEPTDYQAEILEAVRDHRRVAVGSGRKIGKSEIAAMVALWFYCSFPDARVFITASTSFQVTQIIWRALRKQHANAAIKIDGEPRQHAGSGLTAPDGRQVMGFANARREDAAGLSGANLLYIFDEASGIEDGIFEAAEGNRAGAGGCMRALLISNPTRCEGEFYSAFRDKASFYKTFQISSEQSPNYISGEALIPGLASREWVDEMAAMHGRDSPFFKIHVLGQFVEGEEGRILTLHDIALAQQRYAETSAEGPLVIGLDPAGEGVGGDEGVFAARRGRKLIALQGHRGLDEQGYIVHLNAYIKQLAPNERERVTVVVDREGSVGARVYGALRAAAGQTGARFSVVGVRSSDRAQRQPMVYELVRDELWAAAERWIEKEGGAIPEHHKLEKDLHAPSWEGTRKNRIVVTAKTDLRKALGRSPDFGDAVCLSCWVDGGDNDAHRVERSRNAGPTRIESPNIWDAALSPWPGTGTDPTW